MNSATELVLAFLNTLAFLLCGTFIAYVLLIVVPYLRHRPGAVGDASLFSWHFLIPCRDEEAVIERTVERLVVRFPSAEIWCVDDASTDDTPLLLARLTATHAQVHVVTRHLPDARQGKGPALNAGWRAIAGSVPSDTDSHQVIVGVVDADGDLDPRCPDVVAGPSFFGETEVGAVQVRVRVANHGDGHTVLPSTGSSWSRAFSRGLVRMQDIEFGGVIAAMQLLRRHLGSVGMGGNGQFTRLSTLNRIASEHGSPWHGALLEDFELGLHVLLTGDRTEYCHDTWVLQEGLPTLRALMRQRSRWAQGSMQCARYLWPIFRSSRIGTSAALEIAYFLFLPWIELVGGLVFAFSAAVMVFYAATTPGGVDAWVNGGAWGVVPLFVLFGLAPLFLWGPVSRRAVNPQMGLLRSVGVGVANWPYSYIHHVATWWAFARVLRSRGDWKKTERVAVRPASALPVTAVPALVPSRVAVPLGPLVVTGTLTMERGTAPGHYGHRINATGRFHVQPSPSISTPDPGRIHEAAHAA